MDIPGGEVWEELDLSNLPTDFSSGDRVKILFKVSITSSSSPSSWTTAFTSSQISLSTTSSNNSAEVFEFNLPIGNANVYHPIYMDYNSTYVGVLIAMIYTGGAWNSKQMVRIDKVGFNGAGLVYSSASAEVTRSNASTYIKKMWRLKK